MPENIVQSRCDAMAVNEKHWIDIRSSNIEGQLIQGFKDFLTKL